MENNREKKILMMISLSLFMVAILSFGTYALWMSANDLLTGTNTIQSGQVKMSYSESNEIGMNDALPIKDSEGKTLNNYFDFQVLSYIKTRANDDTQRKLNYNIVLEPISVDNPLNDNEIKVYLTMVENGNETVVVEPTTIDKLNQYILKSQEEIFSNGKAEVTTSYRLRAWIGDNVDANKLSEKSYSYRFRVNINNDTIKQEIVPLLNIPVGTNGIEKVTHEIDDTLQVDSKFATEYRYRGGDSAVNNYVTFNNEVWRIIGIIPTEDTDGNVENRLKIIKDASIGDMEWNETEDTTTNTYNNWITGTLNTYLNNDYYNTLTSEAKSMIGTARYYLGGYSDSKITADVMWQYERKKVNGNDCISKSYSQTGTECYFYRTNPVMQNDANKKVAIMYASDYGYAASKECISNLYSYSDSASCKTINNWIDKSADIWLLSQGSNYGDFAFYVNSNSQFDLTNVTDAFLSGHEFMIRPVLFLSSNVKISGGSGTSSDPYTLSVN